VFPEILDNGEPLGPEEMLLILTGDGMRRGPRAVGSSSWRTPRQLAAAFSRNTEILGEDIVSFRRRANRENIHLLAVGNAWEICRLLLEVERCGLETPLVGC